MHRILLVSGSYPPMHCGVGDYTAKLAHAIKESGKAEVMVLASVQQPIELPGIEVIPLSSWDFLVLPELLRTLGACKPDIVHLQFPTQGYAHYWLPWTLPLVLRILGFRVVQTWHEFLPMGGHGRSSFLCIGSDTAIVVRPNFTQSISLWYRMLLRRKKIVCIPNASAIPQSRLSPEEREQLHAVLKNGQEQIVTYFGFANPNKGAELIFRIAEPSRDRLVLICDLTEEDPYQREILKLCESPSWRGKVTVTGFLLPDKVADVLAVSDAVVLPFPEGGGSWNSSVGAALEQGTLVITTSDSNASYDSVSNICYCKPGDVESMARALVAYGGRKLKGRTTEGVAWARIADAHLQIYGEVLAHDKGAST